MWRIPNPTESATFPEIQNPSDTYNPIVTDSKFLFRFNSKIILVITNSCSRWLFTLEFLLVVVVNLFDKMNTKWSNIMWDFYVIKDADKSNLSWIAVAIIAGTNEFWSVDKSASTSEGLRIWNSHLTDVDFGWLRHILRFDDFSLTKLFFVSSASVVIIQRASLMSVVPTDSYWNDCRADVFWAGTARVLNSWICWCLEVKREHYQNSSGAGLRDTMFTVSSTLMWAVLTGPTDWVCHIGTLTLCVEAVA